MTFKIVEGHEDSYLCNYIIRQLHKESNQFIVVKFFNELQKTFVSFKNTQVTANIN